MDEAVQRRAWQERVSRFSLAHRVAAISAASLRLLGTKGVPQRLPCVGVCRTHHHRGLLLAVRRCDGVWWRDHRSGQHHRRRRGGDTGHPAQQYRCRCTRQSAAADRRARPPACMGEVCEERTAQCAAVTTKPGSNYKNRLKHIVWDGFYMRKIRRIET